MARTTYFTATTLDGYIADEEDSLEWLFVQEHDPEGPMSHGAFMSGVGAMVMGATTYGWLLDHMAASEASSDASGGAEGAAGSEGTGPEGAGSEGAGSEGAGSEGAGSEGAGSEGAAPQGWEYDIPCWVMTHRDLPVIEGADIRFASADDPDAVRALHARMAEAAGGRDIWVVGGGGLAADMAEAGVLDAVIVSIAPVTLGAGRPLLPRQIDLQLAEVARNGAFVCARYDVVGPRTP